MNVFIAILTIALIFYFVMRGTGVVHGIQVKSSLIVAIVIMFITELIFLTGDYFKYHEQGIKYVLMSGVILATTTIVEIIHFYITRIFWIYVFQFGLLFFTIVQFAVLLYNSAIAMKKIAMVRKMELEKIKQEMRAKRLETELTQNRVSVMMSQIKPHFLYNALGTIWALCAKEPKTAQKAVEKFSKYLRGNMDSIEKKECIPFADELVHVENYLYIEQLRFGSRLQLEYDIQTETFQCPPLVLQTTVENAVKHGICQKDEGGVIRITTREREDCYEIEVHDTGIGFVVNQSVQDGRSHMGIENTRQRLQSMCNGSLIIKSVVGEGTTATIIVPKGGK